MYWGRRSSYPQCYTSGSRVIYGRTRPRTMTGESEALARISSVGRDVAHQLVKTAVIGVSCAALPTACPAIVAFGKLTDAYETARGIVERVRSDGWSAGSVTRSLASYLTSEASSRLAGPVTSLVSRAIASTIISQEIGTSTIQAIVTSTISNVAEEGADGLIGWAIGDS